MHIHHNILFRILTRLPVKSLLQFRCVSKSWIDMIDSSTFIETHLRFSSQKFTYHNPLFRNQFLCKSIDTLEAFVSPEQHYCLVLPFRVRNVRGSSRGLLCVQFLEEGDRHVFCLCNVLTRKYKILPRDNEPLRFLDDLLRLTSYGFGYDDLHEDYKFIKIYTVKKVDGELVYKVYIYSLKSDKWKLLDLVMPHGWIVEQGILHGHILHWSVKSDGIEKFVLTIDLTTESVGFLPLPEVFMMHRYTDFGSFDGNLGFSVNILDGFNIWIMREYGVKESWVKLKVEIPSLGFNYGWLVKYSETEKQAIFCDGNHGFYWYDTVNKTLYRSPSIRDTAGSCFRSWFYYTESLISPISPNV